jgi:hypothetical protein
MSAEERNGEEPTTKQPRRRSRKDMLKAAGVVAGAAVAGKLATAESASAGDGQDLTIGFANTEELGKVTSLSTSPGAAGPSDPDHPRAAFEVVAPNFQQGLSGQGHDYGVVGTGAGGVLGLGAVGGVFSGSVVAINLDPQDAPADGGPVDAPTGEAFKGDLAVNDAGILWFCVNDGHPGTWIKLSHGGSRYLASPQRAYDSRTSGAGKLRPGAGDTNAPRVIPIAGVVTGVPQNAVGVFGNFTVTGGSQGSFATIWPGGAWPGTSSINFQPNTDLANAFSVGLSASGTVSVATFAPTQVDVIIDVAGYVL